MGPRAVIPYITMPEGLRLDLCEDMKGTLVMSEHILCNEDTA